MASKVDHLRIVNILQGASQVPLGRHAGARATHILAFPPIFATGAQIG
jgi:hypothetical protein